MAIEVSQGWLGTPVPVLGVQVSQAFLSSPGAVVRDAQASQTVGSFTTTATLERVASTQIDVSWVSLTLPESANTTRNAEASQTVGDFTTTASLSDIIGQINGGGTITEGYPHRSAGASQSVGTFQTAAAGGGAGVLAPDLAQAFQAVGEFTTSVVADVRVNATASQTVGDFSQDFRNYDLPTATSSGGGGGGRTYSFGGSVQRKGRRYMTEVNGVTVTATSLADLQRKVQQLLARMPQEAPEPRVEAPKPVTKVAVAEKAPEPPAPPEPIPAEQVERMVADFVAQQQALVDQYQSEVERLRLESQANVLMLRNAMQAEMEQRLSVAQGDLEAVVALLMDESQPAVVYAPPVQVMLPPPIPEPEPKKPDPMDTMAERMDELTKMVKELSKA